jgi:hypothetical protein
MPMGEQCRCHARNGIHSPSTDFCWKEISQKEQVRRSRMAGGPRSTGGTKIPHVVGLHSDLARESDEADATTVQRNAERA